MITAGQAKSYVEVYVAKQKIGHRVSEIISQAALHGKSSVTIHCEELPCINGRFFYFIDLPETLQKLGYKTYMKKCSVLTISWEES